MYTERNGRYQKGVCYIKLLALDKSLAFTSYSAIFSFFLASTQICLTQLIPDLRIGYPYTYYGPLLFVLSVTLIREAIDDHRRYRRDIEINSRKYKKLTTDGVVDVHSAHIKGEVKPSISVDTNIW